MSTLVDVQGNPVSSAPSDVAACPGCASHDLETNKGFGGYWTTHCKKCGREVASGREGQQ